jgi:hypothetical protein
VRQPSSGLDIVERGMGQVLASARAQSPVLCPGTDLLQDGVHSASFASAFARMDVVLAERCG